MYSLKTAFKILLKIMPFLPRCFLALLGSRKKERVVGEKILISKQEENVFHFLFSSGLTGKIFLCVAVYHFTSSLR